MEKTEFNQKIQHLEFMQIIKLEGWINKLADKKVLL